MLGKARLRTKTGCFQCRKQRRKCDERRPICGNCERSRNDNIVCAWPTGREAFIDGRHNIKKLKAAAAGSSSTSSSAGKEKSDHHHHHHPVASNSEKYKKRLIVTVTDSFGDWNGYSEDSASEGCDGSENGGHQVVRRNSYSPKTATVPVIWDLAGPFRSPQEAKLFTFAVNEFLPSVLHQACNKRYFNHTHSLSLAIHFPMLRDCLLACACSIVSSRNPAFRIMAMSYHTSAIRAIRESLNSREYDGTEDFLLGAVALLTIFEGRRQDPSPSMLVSHVSAMGQLHKLRAAKKDANPGSGAQMQSESFSIFERLHAESYLFHTSIMMLFDKVIDPQLDPDVWRAITRAIQNTPDVSDTSRDPVLGVPHPIFELVVQISRLRRQFLATGPDPKDTLPLISINDKLNYWYGVLKQEAIKTREKYPDAPSSWDVDQRSGKLYIIAAKILVTILQTQIAEVLSPGSIPPAQYETKFELLRQGMDMLETTDVDQPFCRHYIWPLSVFLLTSDDSMDLALIIDKLGQIERRSNGGLAKWVLSKFLDGSFYESSMWINPSECSSELDIRGDLDMRVEEVM